MSSTPYALFALTALSSATSAVYGEIFTSNNGNTRSSNGHVDDICRATCSTDYFSKKEICTFTAKVDIYASELGYFQFQECGDVTNPTLGMEVGKTYEFVQADPTNHYHPLGFAYFPDGAHADADELEPGVVPPGSSSTCDTDMTCPAPMYHIGGVYQGTYSNNDDVLDTTENVDNFGLDEYEPKFFHPLPEWIGYGKFSVLLKFDEDTDYSKDIFYFCHIHQFMTGRIKLLRNDQPIQTDHLPNLGYTYDQPAAHDQVCGTYGLHPFQLPNDECPSKFVCDTPSSNLGLLQYSQCIDSMNCAMMAGMTTSVKDTESEAALFIHQMIPHHQNAVNMAKATLKFGKLKCDDLTDEESEQALDCALEVILRDIIVGQNAQIQAMRKILKGKNFPQENDCRVLVETKSASSSGVIFEVSKFTLVALSSSILMLLW